MRLRVIILLVCSCALLYLFNSCKHKPFPAPAPLESGGFPDSIATIFMTKCATAGCHDAASYINADNLRMDTWENLFKGSAHGAVVVPFSTDFSELLYYINTDISLGTVAVPTMPYNGTPLSTAEYNTIKNWIANGAPDKNGNVAFASNRDTRQKIYVTQQGCDLMAVIDAESQLIMRYIPIGVTSTTEAPHAVRITNDGIYAYVSFFSGSFVQKIDTRSDQVVASVSLGTGTGGIVNISPDGQKILVADFANNQLWSVDFPTFDATLIGPGAFKSPHGIASTPNWDTFYVTAQYGNVIYRYTPGKTPPIVKIPVDTTQPSVDSDPGNTYGDPHEIMMTPDHSKLFIACQNTNEVRVLDAHTYKVLAVLPVGSFPQEFAISPAHNEIFVTCMEDVSNPTPGAHGSVYVFNYNTLQQVGSPIYGSFYQPHGISVDEHDDLLCIVSRNSNPNGPAPHHATKCGGRDGWYSFYKLSTLQPVSNTRYEMTNEPYSAATRFQ